MRGVSPILAETLLVAIAIAASVAVYSFIASTQASFQSTQASSASSIGSVLLAIDSVTCSDNNLLTLIVRNVGTLTASGLFSLYLKDPVTNNVLSSATFDANVPPSGITLIHARIPELADCMFPGHPKVIVELRAPRAAPATYAWDTGAAPFSSASGSSGSPSSESENSNSGSSGSSSSGSGTTNHPPLVSLSASPTGAYTDENITFYLSASDPDGDTITCSWDFNDGTTASGCDDKNHAFSAPGTYTVRVTVSDGTDQNVATATVSVSESPLSCSAVFGDPSLSSCYRRTVTVKNNTSSELNDYTVRVDLDTNTLIQQGKLQPDCNDLRFVLSDGTELNYWVENCGDTNTHVWVKIPDIPASGERNVYLYYGNVGAPNRENGDGTFLFFDDFSHEDTNKWTYYAVNTGHYAYETNNGITYLKVWDTDQRNDVEYVYLTSKRSFSPPIEVDWRINVLGVYSGNPRFGLESNSFIAVVNSCACYDWWCANLFGNWYYDLGHRVSYVGKWNTVKIIWTPSEANVLFPPEHYAFGESGSASGPAYLHISGGTKCYCGNPPRQHVFGYDWVFVRKYVSPEPTVTLGTEEQVS